MKKYKPYKINKIFGVNLLDQVNAKYSKYTEDEKNKREMLDLQYRFD